MGRFAEDWQQMKRAWSKEQTKKDWQETKKDWQEIKKDWQEIKKDWEEVSFKGIMTEHKASGLNNVHITTHGTVKDTSWSLIGGEFSWGFRKNLKDLQGCSAEFLMGPESSRMTLTRVGGGALVFGPAGAVVGALAQKDLSKHRLVVHLSDGQELVMEVGQRKAAKAHEFMTKFNNEVRRQLDLRGSAG